MDDKIITKLTKIETISQQTKEQLVKLNGTVAEHTKQINDLEKENLSRKQNCPQQADIDKMMIGFEKFDIHLLEERVREKNIRRIHTYLKIILTLISVIAAIGAIKFL